MNSFKKDLHEKAKSAAMNFKNAERALQEVLSQIAKHKIYFEVGCRSLMDYAVRELGLSRDVAFNHCKALEKAEELSAVKEALKEGSVSVSAVRHMAPVLTKENQKELIQFATQASQADLLKEIARLNPEREERPEKARYVREDRLSLEIRVSEELMKKLRRAQDLASQSERRLMSLEETLEKMTEVFLEKKDPLRKAQRTEKKNQEAAHSHAQALPLEPTLESKELQPKQPAKSLSDRRMRRQPLSAKLSHEVRLANNGQCAHRYGDGTRCNQTRFLHVHHIQPVSEGGANTLQNLTLLCSGHHRMTHALLRST